MFDCASGKKPPLGQGVRHLRLIDIAPDCDIVVTNEAIYDLDDLSYDSLVLDIGCGHGRNRNLVESVGGYWVGLEMFPGGQK